MTRGIVRAEAGFVHWINRHGKQRQWAIVPLPEAFVRWQLEWRATLYKALRSAEKRTQFAPPHLPVLATLNGAKAPAPINLAAKGVTLLPREDRLQEVVDQIEQFAARGAEPDYSTTWRERVGLVERIFADAASFHPSALGGLEIFEGRTYRNLVRDPRASLLFLSGGPDFVSYQIDVIAELVRENDLRYRYLSGLRRLFEGAPFHVPQSRYGCGYVFWVIGVSDKTPRTRSWE
jgi:hypothetical protein